jgi:ATP/maltotriose-dependent transcriptional regulator MalT
LLTDASVAPSALILDGEAGIGKTTLWLAAVEEARERGFLVLSTRTSASESVMGYTALADLLSPVEPSAWADLPVPQRQAVDRVTLRTNDGNGQAYTDRRAVAAGFMSVVDQLTRDCPVLLAIDDVQWLDSSSVHVLEFVARRLKGPVGMLAAVRTPATRPTNAAWLRSLPPDRLNRITLRPLTVGALHAIVLQRLGRSYSRPTMLRIHQTSGGNPFYAIELARSIEDERTDGRSALPRSLTELVDQRIASLDQRTESALLACSCLATPTVELVSRATDTDPAELVDLLEPAENQGIVTLDGNRLRFTHPLLAMGVYERASPSARRAMHRRLGELIDEPESQARHLALAATRGDPATLRALDTAADIARSRGAPESSAELVSLALTLGGDTPERRIRLAGLHFNAGDSERARKILDELIASLERGALRSRAMYLLGVVGMFDDSFTDAAQLLARALDEVGDDPALRAEMLIILAFAQINSGRGPEALVCVDEAVSLSETLERSHLLSQALGMRTTLLFMAGEGVDRTNLARAVELEDLHVSVPIAIRPSVQSALLDTWTGELDRARKQLAVIRHRCIEHGEDSELIFVSFHTCLLNVWRGDFAALALDAEETLERALQLNGDVPRYVALVVKSLAAAHAGDVEGTRRDGSAAHAAALRSGAANLAQWPVMALGFLEVSLGRYEAALATLEPQLVRLAAAPRTMEIISAWFLPDAIEAMIQLGRLDEAERWVTLLEDNGARLDRAWSLAVGGRCRGMLLAANADLDGAIIATEHALLQHDRLPMPFERARTLLLLGQLQRRLRRQDRAATILQDALDEFQRLGTPLWAERAREQLARTNTGRRGAAVLTPSELRVAELAAAGMTNRDVATTLFISPKTVEANLSRIYRKLGIHSRAELGRRMGESAG